LCFAKEIFLNIYLILILKDEIFEYVLDNKLVLNHKSRKNVTKFHISLGPNIEKKSNKLGFIV